uniref:Uncharacterized protein n=1 Tax=Eutreptiella gymnastica TaxID=73025 RepID=A0A7S4G7A0_9EUGL
MKGEGKSAPGTQPLGPILLPFPPPHNPQPALCVCQNLSDHSLAVERTFRYSYNITEGNAAGLWRAGALGWKYGYAGNTGNKGGFMGNGSVNIWESFFYLQQHDRLQK